MSSEYLESPVVLNDLKDAKSVFIKEKFYDTKTLHKIGETLTEYAVTKTGCIPTLVYDRNSNGHGMKHKQFDRKAFVLVINACSYKREVNDKFTKIVDVWKSIAHKGVVKQEERYTQKEVSFKKYLIEMEKMQELKARNSMNIIHKFHNIFGDETLNIEDNDKIIIMTFGEDWFRDACFSTKTKYRRAFRDYKDFIKRKEIFQVPLPQDEGGDCPLINNS